MCICALLCVYVCSVWVHVFLGLIDHREFLLNFWSDPLRLNAALSLFLLFSLSLSPALYHSPSGEKAIETLELGSGCVGVKQLKCQTRLYHLGVYLK